MAHHHGVSGRQSTFCDTPSLEPVCEPNRQDLLLRLRSQNQALEKLRDALDLDDDAGIVNDDTSISLVRG